MADKFSFQKEQYKDYARQMAEKYNLPEDMFLAQLEQESNWDPKATSRTGAKGIGQFQEKWHPVGTWAFKKKEDYFDPKKSIESAAMYMNSLQNQYKGNYMAALAHYNGGTKQGQLVASGKSPNVGETANYIPLIEKRAEKYRRPDSAAFTNNSLEGNQIVKNPQMVIGNLRDYFSSSNSVNTPPKTMLPKEESMKPQATSSPTNNPVLQIEELKKALAQRELAMQEMNIQSLQHQQQLNQQQKPNGMVNVLQALQGMSAPTNNQIPQVKYQNPGNYTPKFQLPKNNPWR